MKMNQDSSQITLTYMKEILCTTVEPLYNGHVLLRTPLYSGPRFEEPSRNYLLKFISL